ncbi:MAG: histidine--tRNA ligase [Gemmatimonadetes bacterium]|nr:histidine--tRNA ligase [Gemmatimonadota bacterium]
MAGGALPGFRDFYPDEFAHRAHIMRAWREVARRHAFVEYDGPPLEPLDLYTRKSGDEIVGQLYNFTDKGDRQVALRPEMTPTFARMVAARANALRKPVRWFSIPQLFRYERQQKGRLREHFQLNVDIVGESDVLADAELLTVAIDCMRELGLTHEDLRARVSDRRLLHALLGAIGISDDQRPAVFAAIDKAGKIPREAYDEMLANAGLTPAQIARLHEATAPAASNAGVIAQLRGAFGSSPDVGERLASLEEYLAHLRALGAEHWVALDLRIVRGLGYYTGIVFELFDIKGDFRAICGGGRYDNLLRDLGGVDLPALGFGMGDVVLGELLKQRGLMPVAAEAPEFVIVSGPESTVERVLEIAAALRSLGRSVEFPLSAEKLGSARTNSQLQTAHKIGAEFAVVVRSGASADVRLMQVDGAGGVELDVNALCGGNKPDAARALDDFLARADQARRQAGVNPPTKRTTDG